ncbi:hypothetical protein [Salsipaludibacter albus]|uniref:hypothetical protein n=1 Tax=Salsipaludibacter albus TaxID=2849650 RepID=UPI001EE3CE34|nr:hypothetical protein [Salsipaludibacter albus]MBY5161643.1 hypothetical protein [Salsipaludibacter albus]
MAAKKTSIQIPVERQKAAQAAGTFDLDELPGILSNPDAAVRLAKTAKGDKALKSVRSLNSLAKISNGQIIANYGRSESRWAQTYQRRRAGNAEVHELLSYARQLVGISPDGELGIFLMGHAGQGSCIPLWVPQEEVTLTVQPNDIVMRFDESPLDAW